MAAGGDGVVVAVEARYVCAGHVRDNFGSCRVVGSLRLSRAQDTKPEIGSGLGDPRAIRFETFSIPQSLFLSLT